MTITIRPGVAARMHDTVFLRVRSPAPAGQVAAAMDAARWDIAGPADADGPSYVGEPVPVPDGVFMMIDFANTPPGLAREAPATLARHLEAAGIGDAEIGVARELSNARFEFLGSLSPVARAWLRPPLPRFPPIGLTGLRVPDRLRTAAAGWLRAQARPDTGLTGLIASVAVPLTWENLRPVADGVLATGNQLTVIATDFRGQASAITFGVLFQTGVSLAAAGGDRGQVTDWMRGQRELISSLAPEIGWAGVTGHVSSTFPVWLPPSGPGTPEDTQPGPLWYQVLPAADLARAGRRIPDAADLPGGRVEITIGEPIQWLPGHPDHDRIRAHARDLFGLSR